MHAPNDYVRVDQTVLVNQPRTGLNINNVNGSCEHGVNGGVRAFLHLDKCTSASNKELNARVDAEAVVGLTGCMHFQLFLDTRKTNTAKIVRHNGLEEARCLVDRSHAQRLENKDGL
jgi:hypothetical protein